MRIFITTYAMISLLVFILNWWVGNYHKKHGDTPTWHRMHDLLHNIGLLLRILLVLLVCYLVYRSAKTYS